MCRLTAYFGPPLQLAELTHRPPHSLLRQSWAHREMPNVAVNADGWGAAWYLEDDPIPCLYRSTSPIWADLNAPHLSRGVRSRCLLAAVRSATDPSSVAPVNTQPFGQDTLTFLHNGCIRDFSRIMMRQLRHKLSDSVYASLVGSTDSEHVFALFRHHMNAERTGTTQVNPESMVIALSQTVRCLRQLAAQADTAFQLTVVISNGHGLLALRHAHGTPAPTLYVAAHGAGVTLASEPLSDGAPFRPLPVNRILTWGFQRPPEEQPLDLGSDG